jgi:C1A family cysteine protease
MVKQRIFPLIKLVGFEPKLINKFSKYGIDSAEELVALAAIPGELSRVAKLLNLDEPAAKKIIDNAKLKLPKELREKMSKPSNLKVKLGVRKPERRKKFEATLAKYPEKPAKRMVSQFAQAIATAPSITAPVEYDLTDQLTDVKDQGNRGTCVAFSAVAVREFLAGSQPDLSEQFLYWWCDDHDPVPEEPGTTVEMGFNGLFQAGVCKESTWRYNSEAIKGNEGQGPPPAGASDEAKDYKITKILDLDENSIDELKKCLNGTNDLPGRPIAFSIPVYNSWLLSNAVMLSGQITMPLPGEEVEGGHAMVMVGYQDDASVPGGGFFIIRNSWGPRWGQNCTFGAGYGTIPYQYITKYCWEAFTGEAKTSGKSCFIATAAYGSPYAKEVQFLRNFRDVKLKSTTGGKTFVDFYEGLYYMFSPKISQKMQRDPALKNIIRWVVVSPIVYFLRRAVGLIEHGKK